MRAIAFRLRPTVWNALADQTIEECAVLLEAGNDALQSLAGCMFKHARRVIWSRLFIAGAVIIIVCTIIVIISSTICDFGIGVGTVIGSAFFVCDCPDRLA